MFRPKQASTINSGGRAWERCCSGQMPSVQKQVLVLCPDGTSLLPSKEQPVGECCCLLCSSFWHADSRSSRQGRKRGHWWEKQCPALCQLPLKTHPMGIRVGCRCSPSQPSHTPDKLGDPPCGIGHHRQLLQAMKSSVFPTAERGRARQAPAVPKDSGLMVAGCDQGWHLRSWGHLLTCSLPPP